MLKATGELPDISILPFAPLETLKSSFGLPVMLVVVLDSGESEREKVKESTWFGSLRLTSASMPAVDWAVHRRQHVRATEMYEESRISRRALWEEC